VGVNVAPVVLLEGWQELYAAMFETLAEGLLPDLKRQLFFEVIFMTYGLANEQILSEAMPNAVNLLDRSIMRPKGRGKYCYKPETRLGAEGFIINEINRRFPGASISYIC
jgi:spore photoproduct lyase